MLVSKVLKYHKYPFQVDKDNKWYERLILPCQKAADVCVWK